MPDGICPFADVRLLPSSNYSFGYVDRVGFCDHTAGGWYRTLADTSFWIGNGLSVHFGIGRKGEIVQLVNIFNSAYGQGRLGPAGWAGVTWPYKNDPNKPYSYTNPNYLFISTEHEDITPVGYVPGAQWTEEEYAADLRVKRWCIEEAKRVKNINLMQYDIDSLTGHHMFDPVNRVNCPGLYWRNEYRTRLFRDLTNPVVEDDMFVRWGGAANAEFWHGRIPVVEQGVGARGDWKLPVEARSIELELFLINGAVDVMDGGTTGKAFYAEAGVYHGRVMLDRDGNFWIKRIVDDTQIDKMVCLGYYT